MEEKKDLGTEGETSPQPVGEEEKREKGREDKERNRERVCNPAPLDPSVTSPYGPQWSYGEPILVTLPAHRAAALKGLYH